MQVFCFLLFYLPALAVLASAIFLCFKDRFKTEIGNYLLLLLVAVGVSMGLYAEYFSPYVYKHNCWGFDFLYCMLSPFCAPVYYLFLNKLTKKRKMPAMNFIVFLPSIIYAVMLVTTQLLLNDADRHAYMSNVILGRSIQIESSEAFDWLYLIGYRVFKFFAPIQAILVMIYGEFRLNEFVRMLKEADAVNNSGDVTRLRGIHTLSFLVAALALFISIIPVYEILAELWLVGIVMAIEMVLVSLVASYVVKANVSPKAVLATAGVVVSPSREVVTESVSRVVPALPLIERIDAAMKRDNLFLRSDLTLISLAEHVGTNRTYVSKAIKDSRGVNFSDYLNRYRLDYAIQLLKSTPKEDIIIQNIAVQCGCGSIQTFYRYFKLFFNETPSQWIERNK